MPDHRLTTAWLLRHVPQQGALGAGVAALDVAQDLILTDLHHAGVFDGLVVFKGGTALRKLFAGEQGRFSTDLDFAMADMSHDPAAVGALIAGQIGQMRHDRFTYQVEEQRGRWTVHVDTNLTDVDVPQLKLDVGPPSWLKPEKRSFEPMAVHNAYLFDLPQLPVMQLAENLTEKIARLTRLSAARDASDLVWAATTTPYSQMDRDLMRQLVVLKVWVDNHGLDGHWRPAQDPQPFEPEHWLREGRSWDDEDIGLLTHPPPRLEDLEADLRRYFQWLGDLDDDARRFATADRRDEADIVDAVAALPGSALTADVVWSHPR